MNSASERLRIVGEALSKLCPSCAGYGRVSKFTAVGDKVVRRSEVCDACQGTGLTPEDQ